MYNTGKSGSFEFTDGYFTVRVRWSETYNIAENTSIVRVDGIDVKGRAMLGKWYPSLILKVNGETLAQMQYYNVTHVVNVGTVNTYYTVTTIDGQPAAWESSPIQHDALGLKTIDIAVVANPAGHNLTSIQIYRTDGTIRTFTSPQVATVQLTDIPRRSVINAAAGILGQPQNVAVTRYFDGYTHTVTCKLGSETAILCEKSSETELTWTPPISWAAQVPNAPKGSAVYRIVTYNGDSEIGSYEASADLVVPDDLVPTAQAAWTDSSGAFEVFEVYVKLVSALSVEVNGAGVYGSTITGADMTLNGKPYTGGEISESGDLQLVATVTDSRGRSGSASYVITVADYEMPAVELNASRCTEDGTADDMGEYARITVTGFVYPLNERNSGTLTLTYGSNVIEQGVAAGEVSFETIVEAPSISTMSISAVITDLLKSGPRQSMTLSIGFATIDFLAGGRGIAFGTTAKKEGFDCYMDTDFGGHAVTGLPEPKQDSDAVPKSYVDKIKAEAKEPLRYTEQGALEIQLAEEPTDGSKLPITAGAVYSALNAESRAPKILQVEAATPVSVDMTDGEIYAISYVTSYTGTGDIFLKVNEAAPKVASYTFSGGAGNYTGGIITFSGGTSSASFFGFVQVINGRVNAWGNGIRGNGTGHGWATAYWVAASVTSLTFTRAGTLTIQKL